METKNVIVRTTSAGVFFAEEIKREQFSTEAELIKCRCLWYWEGAASLLQLAAEGVTKPKDCKFTMSVERLTVLGIIEVIPCTQKAIDSINSVREWKV